MAKAKPMNRSRNQLATAYAPLSFFTFEGGVGACIAHAVAGEPVTLLDATRAQIIERFEEFGLAWFQAAMQARDHKTEQRQKHPILPEMCVEKHLLDECVQEFRVPGIDRLYFSKPSNMGYTPAPLTFVCRYCDLFREYSTLRDFTRALPALQAARCSSSRAPCGTCSWEQLDVIFVHWSGSWAPATPNMWDYRDGGVTLNPAQCPSCGSSDFRLNRNSPKLGEWHFVCAQPTCGKARDRWLQNDQDTLEMLKTKVGEGRLTGPTEVRMEATPYRASNAYYVQTELFIDFRDGTGTLSGLLRPGAQPQLEDFIARTYGFEGTPPTDAEVEQICEAHPDCAKDLQQFRNATRTITRLSAILDGMDPAARGDLEDAIRTARDSQEQVLQRLRERRILLPRVALPSGITAAIAHRRHMFAARFDPFRLSVEHAMLKRARLDVAQSVGGKRPYVSFKLLDEDLAPDSADETRDLETTARARLAALGIADMGLVREFELCRFSFGYSRMQAGPVLRDKRGMDMPVRLRLFPLVQHDGIRKHPLYVIQQANQAIYVRLDEEATLAWLKQLGCDDMFSRGTHQAAGAGILNTVTRMDRFLEGLPTGESPPVYLYLYTLIHSFAHLVMKQVSAFSGLDLGSLGEYIFPADLAFVIYRNGTTMDLGNLSAMWRNSGRALMSSLLDPRAAQCGTGSLCTTRGGSCPDCLMIPETSCIASNKLLSRAVLRGIGGRPRYDTRSTFVTPGYFDTVRTLHSSPQQGQ
jgi:hypothetical protein